MLTDIQRLQRGQDPEPTPLGPSSSSHNLTPTL